MTEKQNLFFHFLRRRAPVGRIRRKVQTLQELQPDFFFFFFIVKMGLRSTLPFEFVFFTIITIGSTGLFLFFFLVVPDSADTKKRRRNDDYKIADVMSKEVKCSMTWSFSTFSELNVANIGCVCFVLFFPGNNVTSQESQSGRIGRVLFGFVYQ